MKILHVVPTYWPATRYGGPIYSVHGLCSALVDKGLSISVFTTSVDGKNNSNVEHQKCYSKDGVNIYYYESKFLRRIYFSRQLKQALVSRIKEFDLVHLHSIFLYPTNIAARIAASHSIPYILSPRGMLEKSLIQSKSPLIKKTWLKLFERTTLEQARLIHLTAEREKTELFKFDYNYPGSVVIPNGVDGIAIHDQDSIQKSGIFQILFLGRLSWKKKIDKLIKSLEFLDFETRLIVAGNDEEGYKNRLLQLANSIKAPVKSNSEVIFVDEVNGQEKKDLFLKSQVMVLPSLSENFGNTVIEAMAAGCPVIVTPEVGASEVVERAKSGLITNGTPEDIARQITHIKTNPEQAKQMAINGIHEVKENYQWSSIADAMIKAYEGIISKDV